MSFVEISECRICRNNNLINVIDLGNQVIGARFPIIGENDPVEIPLILIKCDDSLYPEKCGLLQLKYNVNPNELYLHNYGYRSGINKTMVNHLNLLVKNLENNVDLENDDVVIDIGSNDATLLKSYQNNNLKKIGIDPTGTQFKQYYTNDITLIPDFFSSENYFMICSKKAKIVTSISMFYDLPDPLKFMMDIKKILDINGIWVTEQSYMVTMLEKNSFDTICHEHLEYYAFKQMEWMAQKVGLKIVDVVLNDCNGGSFKIKFAHENSFYKINEENIKLIKDKENYLSLNLQKPYIEFNNRCLNLKNQLVNFLKFQKQMGKKIFIYGASTKGNTLLQYYNLDNTIITAAADRNPEKMGRRTPKTNIPIISENGMREEHPDFLLVLPWHFKEEFLEREHIYLSKGGQFIFPLPKIDIISNNKENPL